MRKFFVYGTLMEGMSNHEVIPQEAIESIEKASISNMDLYPYASGAFPCMIPGDGIVRGEVITVKPEYLEVSLLLMDQLEGYDDSNLKENNFYNREVKAVALDKNEYVEAYAYVYNDKSFGSNLGSRIIGGDFKLWKIQSL